MGLLLYRRGAFAEAEAYLRRAVESLTRRNPNPYDGEPFYNLGLALKMQGRHTEAKDAFYRAAWSAAWQDAACFQLARLACRAGQLTEAVALTGEALARNGRHYKARHLRAALLRRLGQAGEARAETEASLSMDPLEFGALWERRLLLDDPAFERFARGVAHTYIEIALDYIHAGLYPEAAGVLTAAPAGSAHGAVLCGLVPEPVRRRGCGDRRLPGRGHVSA